ncbi:hypothetical protein OS493_029563 [Desmophyllum pertusum]|uniref:Uncharacterized protein n=1 Tax=Desmophyllum pertusum TaxID=174260 RepID=A0A9X0A121_9CNID|nr:hypothetical protein OS493_029563 [Desmophyllum pertusum]
MVNSASIMKKKKVFIGILVYLLILNSISEVTGSPIIDSQESLADKSLDERTPTGFNNPSVRRTASGDKITDVDITPYESAISNVRSSKSSSVHNQEDVDRSTDGRKTAPTMHEAFKSMKLTANSWRDKKQTGNGDVSFLAREALKRGRDVASKQATNTAAHNPQETTTDNMNKLLEMAMPWKRPEDTGTILDASSSEAMEHSFGDDPVEPNIDTPSVYEQPSSKKVDDKFVSVTGEPYATEPGTPPNLANHALEGTADHPPASETQTANSAGLPTIESAEYDVNTKLDSADSPTADESQGIPQEDMSTAEDNVLDPPESSGISSADGDVSFLAREALKRGRDVASKQATNTEAHNPQETTTDDMNKELVMAMPWKRKNGGHPEDRGTILDTFSSEAKEHSSGDDPVEPNSDTDSVYEQPSSEQVDDKFVLQSHRPSLVTGVPYATEPGTPPNLTNHALEGTADHPPASDTQTENSAGLSTTDSAEYDVNMNLDSADSPTADESQGIPQKDMSTAEDNVLDPPESSGIFSADEDVSFLAREALKRGRDVASKQAKNTAARNPQETTTDDMNKVLEMAMPWKRPEYTGKILDASSSESMEHSFGDDPVEPNSDTPSVYNHQSSGR